MLMDLKQANDSGGIATTMAFIYNPKGADPAGMGLWRGKDLFAQIPPPHESPWKKKRK